MSKISPRVDIAFKKIFGVEENKDLLISLVNSIVGPADQVSDLTLLNPYNPKNFKQDKLSILDIKALGVDGKRFNIEIQITDAADYDKRALYYWAKLYTEQLKAAEYYSTLSKAIGIHILNFTSIPETPKYHNVFHVREKDDSSLTYFKDLELHTIELRKFSNNPDEELAQVVAKVKNALDVWMAFLTRHELLKKDDLPEVLDDPKLAKAMHVLEVMNFTEEERDSYEEHLKWLRMEAGTLEKVREDGIAEGEAKGRAEGIEIGEAKGEAKRNIEIAKKMLQMNIDVNTISAATGLNKEEISKLLSQI
jgi:hypothetical protein